MRTRTLAALALVPALALTLPACGAAAGKSKAAQQAADLTRMRAFAKCMRDNGVDMPDPNTDGGVQIRMTAGAGGPQTLDAAQAKCRHLMPNGGKPMKPNPADLAKMRAFAKCMRDHGVNMPDPNPNGGGQVISKKGDSGPAPDSQAFKAADQACRKYQPGGSHLTNVAPGGANAGPAQGVSGGAG